MDKLDYDVLLFDLDGTLTDSIDGIVNAVCYACEKLGIRIPTQEELLEFIGPPMTHSFTTHFGLEGRTLDKAIDFYHDYYSDKGWKENRVIDGIIPMLEDLKRKGKQMCIRDRGTVVVSDTQTSGRGRLGRVWKSKKGTGVYMSILLRPDISPVKIPSVTLCAGLAV